MTEIITGIELDGRMFSLLKERSYGLSASTRLIQLAASTSVNFSVNDNEHRIVIFLVNILAFSLKYDRIKINFINIYLSLKRKYCFIYMYLNYILYLIITLY